VYPAVFNVDEQFGRSKFFPFTAVVSKEFTRDVTIRPIPGKPLPCIHSHAPVFTHTPLYSLTRLCIHSHAPVFTHTPLYSLTHPCIHSHTPVFTHTPLYSLTHPCIHSHTPVFTHAPLYSLTRPCIHSHAEKPSLTLGLPSRVLVKSDS
jgi:hypothetical protein